MQVLHGSVEEVELGYVLNASVVGLVGSSIDAQNPGLPSCLGMGIVRSVDMQKRMLYVLTPLSEDQLEAVTKLQVGEVPSMQLPSLADAS